MVDTSKLRKILFDLHAVFIYTSDEERYGQGDYWASPEEAIGPDGKVRDDCDGFAMVARRKIVEAGGQARLILVKIADGRYHLVAESGGWVLNNIHKELMTRQELERLGWEFISMSGYNQSDPWTTVK